MQRRIAISLAALLITLTGSAWAGSVEITPHVGYRLETGLGGKSLDDGVAYGLMLDIPTKWERTAVEVFWNHEETSLESGDTELFDVEQDVLQVGLRHLLAPPAKSLRPFVTWSAGVSRFDPPNYLSGTTRTALGVGGGGLYDAGKRVAVRFEGRGLVNFINAGNGIFCTGAPNGCALTENSATIWQLDLVVGLVFKTGK